MTKWSLSRIFAERQRKRLRRCTKDMKLGNPAYGVRKLLTWQKERFLHQDIPQGSHRLSNIQLLSIISARELSRSPVRMWMEQTGVDAQQTLEDMGLTAEPPEGIQ